MNRINITISNSTKPPINSSSTPSTTLSLLRLVNSNFRVTRALVPLSSNNLVVVATKLHAILGPSIEMVASRDGAANTLLRADRPVLGESLGAVDGRSVGAGCGVDVVGAAVRSDGSLELHAVAGVVGAVGVEDVVLDERVAGPAVDAEVGVAGGVEGAGVFDGSGGLLVGWQ